MAVKKAIGCVSRIIRKHTAPPVFKKIYAAVFLPRLLYGVELCFPYRIVPPGSQNAPPNSTLGTRLFERVHLFAARAITNIYQQDAQPVQVLKAAQFPTFSQLAWSRRLKQFYHYVKGDRFLPPLLAPLPARHRRFQTFVQYKPAFLSGMFTRSQNSFFSRTPKIWNILPPKIFYDYKNFCQFLDTVEFYNVLEKQGIKPIW